MSLVFAVPDPPWVDGANGAAIRIAITVVANGTFEGQLLTVQVEDAGDFGEMGVTMTEVKGLIHPDLSVGANVAGAMALQAMTGISSPGVKLHGAGFIVTRGEAVTLGLGTVSALDKHTREHRNGRDLAATPRHVVVLDMFGLNAEAVRSRFPAVYQWVMEQVKPERDQNNRPTGTTGG